MIIGTAGHIDHGKTGLVKALTGVDTDRLPEEKKRGITLELGFAPVELPGFGSASIIDVPGHEAFVKAMIAGAAGIDVALLVVAADEGVMPQTREHLAILRLLGIPRLVVALSKSDIVDDDWLSLVREDVRALVTSTEWPNPQVIACSALTGAGCDLLLSELSAAAATVTRESAQDLFRLPVDRAFTVKGTGTVVTGSVWSGSLSADSEVRVLPGGKRGRARRLHRHGIEVERVNPGERAAIALGGLNVEDVPRGSVLVTSAEWEPAGSLDAWISLSADSGIALRSGAIVRFQLGGAEVGATLATHSAKLNAGYSGFARIKLESPIAARGGDRFVVRLPAPIGTIGGGVILDLNSTAPFNRAANRFGPADTANAELRLRAILELSGDAGVASASLPIRLGCPLGDVDSLLARVGAVGASGFVFASAVVLQNSEALLKALEENERTFPLSSGVQLESLKSSLRCRGELMEAALEKLKTAGDVVVDGPLARRAGWKPVLSGRDEKTIDSIVHAICAGGREPPSVGELEEKFGGDVVGLLHYLEREGRVIQVDSARFYAPGTVAELVAALRAGLQEGVEYDPSQLRVVLGFSRKYLIPFLEYCDRAGITERRAGGRSLRKAR